MLILSLIIAVSTSFVFVTAILFFIVSYRFGKCQCDKVYFMTTRTS